MFTKIAEWFLSNPRIKASALFIVELEKFVVTGAVITYAGKPVFDKDSCVQTGFPAALKRAGKIGLAIGTLGGTLVYDLIMDPPVTNATVIAQVDVAVDLKHGDIRGELVKALSSANESAAKLEELLNQAIASRVFDVKGRVRAPMPA